MKNKSSLLFITIAFCVGLLNGQPSGGPYGPIQMNYAIPHDAGTAFHVAPDGNPGSPGTSPDAPTRIEQAIARANTGDVIVFHGGIYRTGSLEFNQGITLQPHGEDHVVLKGTRVAREWQKLPSGLWRTRWDTLFPAEPESWWRSDQHGHTTPLYWFNNDMLFFDGKLLKPAGVPGDVEENSYFINYEEGMVYIGGDPRGHLVEITAHDNALTRCIGKVHGKESDGRGPIIRGITFTQYAYRAIEIEGKDPEGLSDPSTFGNAVTGTLLENVTITYCSRVAGYFRGDGMVIRNCLISDTETEGIFILASSDVLLERNIIRRNNMQNMKGYYPAAVKIFNQCHNVVCRDNLVYESPHSSGIWYDVGNVDGLFVDNWIEDSTDGFFFEISQGAVVAGNVFVNCEKGVRSLNSSDVEVYHNTFVNSMASFERTDRGGPGDHFGWHPSTGPAIDARDGHIFRNNLLVADETYHRVLFNTQQSPVLCDELTNSQMKELDFNVYVRKGARPGEPTYSWSPTKENGCKANFRNLAGFRDQVKGFSHNSQEFMDYQGQVLKSMRLRNFHLLAEFPASAYRGPLDQRVLDILGWDAEEKPHPGAYGISNEK